MDENGNVDVIFVWGGRGGTWMKLYFFHVKRVQCKANFQKGSDAFYIVTFNKKN